MQVGWLTKGRGVEPVGVVGLSAEKLAPDADEERLVADPQGERTLLLG